jgi:hypothetical protein
MYSMNSWFIRIMTRMRISSDFTTNLKHDKTHSQNDSTFKETRVVTTIMTMTPPVSRRYWIHTQNLRRFYFFELHRIHKNSFDFNRQKGPPNEVNTLEISRMVSNFFIIFRLIGKLTVYLQFILQIQEYQLIINTLEFSLWNLPVDYSTSTVRCSWSPWKQKSVVPSPRLQFYVSHSILMGRLSLQEQILTNHTHKHLVY